ncbi:hypothetical protein QT381_02635 [Galbitalea sp. SE-J8]|uniref:hypothetical protein n=1 Tax=Galbitalea sp. SE-J8 TaxID=3054952 RepID=UPI00259CC77A|nr:hypothetical protein [Galbitalea sp. SE-J8]MDM4761900.1 hypothetical protein [Galbitalea sp. SE-J8]
MNTYSTRTEAIAREIVAAIEGSQSAAVDEFDIDAIADEIIAPVVAEEGPSAGYITGYRCTVTPDEFWTIVEKHAL